MAILQFGLKRLSGTFSVFSIYLTNTDMENQTTIKQTVMSSCFTLDIINSNKLWNLFLPMIAQCMIELVSNKGVCRTDLAKQVF